MTMGIEMILGIHKNGSVDMYESQEYAHHQNHGRLYKCQIHKGDESHGEEH